MVISSEGIFTWLLYTAGFGILILSFTAAFLLNIRRIVFLSPPLFGFLVNVGFEGSAMVLRWSALFNRCGLTSVRLNASRAAWAGAVYRTVFWGATSSCLSLPLCSIELSKLASREPFIDRSR